MAHSEIISQFLTTGKRKYDRLSEVTGIPVADLVRFNHRGSIPPKHWPAFVKAAAIQNVDGVDLDTLAGAAR